SPRVLAVQIDQMRDRHAAGAAPRGPHVHHDDPSLEVFAADRSAAQRGDVERERWWGGRGQGGGQQHDPRQGHDHPACGQKLGSFLHIPLSITSTLAWEASVAASLAALSVGYLMRMWRTWTLLSFPSLGFAGKTSSALMMW